MDKKGLLLVTKAVLLVALLMDLSGCETLKRLNQIGPELPKYTPAVSDSTTFVILPFNDYLDQLEFAANVERAMIQSGLNVIAPPRGIKEVEERKGAGLAQTSGSPRLSDTGSELAESQSLRIERYKVIEDSKADYFIETMRTGSDGTIKFTRKNDRKVISVFNVYAYPSSIESEIIKQLAEMGFLKEE